MGKMVFKCAGQDLEVIPEDAVAAIGSSYREIYSRRDAMAAMALEMKRRKQDSLCKVPFCVSVEAEALGAHVRVEDSIIPPALHGYACKTGDELKSLPDIDFSSGRIHEVLESASILAGQGECVSIRAEAPFTILMMLMDLTGIALCFRKCPEALHSALDHIGNQLAEYIRLAVGRGARIISYSDPSGIPDYIGDEFYRELCAKPTCRVLRKVQPYMQLSVVHLCGRTSAAMQNEGFCRSGQLPVKAQSYGEALAEAAGMPDIWLLGHGCLQKTAEPANGRLHVLQLLQE